MRMVIAQVDHEVVQPLHAELLGFAVGSLSLSEVSCPDHRRPLTLHYRGATLTHVLRRKARLECVVADEDVPSVVAAVARHTRAHPDEQSVLVLALETELGLSQEAVEQDRALALTR